MAGENTARNKATEVRKQDILGINWQDHMGS